MTALSDLLNEAKGDHSVDYLMEEARKRNVTVKDSDRSLIYKVLSGDHARNPRDSTLRLLAEVFRLKVVDLREAAGRPRGELGPWKPVDEAAQLSQPIRDAFDELIKVIVREGGGAHADRAAANTPGDEDPVINLGGRRGRSKLSGPADPYGTTERVADDPDDDGSEPENEGPF